MVLTGRADELVSLSSLFDDAETGKSAALVLRGDAGVGKTALLEAAIDLARGRGMATIAIAGIEDEAPIGWAALHRVLHRFPGAIDRLPTPQRDALRSTLGLTAGPPPDRYLVGLGVLTLLADRAVERPLVTVIDDAQWLDPESSTVFGFAARRLDAEAVVALFAISGTDARPLWLSGIPELAVDRLGDGDAASLLRDVTGGPLNPDVEGRLLREGGGNPLALREMARQLTPEQLAGAVDVPEPLPLMGSIQQLFARRIAHLGPGSRRLLAVAAAEPTVSERVASVVAGLGVEADEVEPELEGFLRFGDVVQFSHPLVRSVAYYGTPAAERRAIHRGLAREMDSPETADRAAWHLAMAATTPDEAVASRLEQAGRRARLRGGYAATSTLLQRAAALSADGRRRAARLLSAAEAALAAARPEQARALLDDAQGLPMDERQAAEALRLSGDAFFATAATDDAARELLAAAQALLPLEPSLARRTLLTSLIAAAWGPTEVLDEVCSFTATIAEAHLSVDAVPNVPDLFLFGFLHRQAGDSERASQFLRKALTGLEHPGAADDIRVAVPPIVPLVASVELLGEGDNFALSIASSYADFARRTGALTVLPGALIAIARVRVGQGRFADAEVGLTEVTQLVRATGAPGTPDISAELKLFILCWRGDEAAALAIADELAAAGGRPEPGFDLASADLAVLDLGKGRYRQAFERLEPITRQDRLGFGTVVLTDFIEAAARCGERTDAMIALDRLATRATAASDAVGAWPPGPLPCGARRRRRRAAASGGDRAPSRDGLGDRSGQKPPRVRRVAAAPAPTS